MKVIFKALLIYGIVISTSYAREITLTYNKNGETTYIADLSSGTLSVKWDEQERKINNIVGIKGQSYTTLLKLNDRPALHHSNAASSTSFDIYYTLHKKDDAIYIDCIYADISSHINGVTTRKGVCELNVELKENFQDLAYTYTDKWLETANKANLSSLFESPETPVKISLGEIQKSTIYSFYSSQTDALERNPSTIIVDNGKTSSLGKKRCFLIYKADNLNLPTSLEVENLPGEPFTTVRSTMKQGEGFIKSTD